MSRLPRLVAAVGIASAAITAAPLGHAGIGELSFTPTGLRLSIMRISVGSMVGTALTSEQVLYKCAKATEEECLVDVTSQTELDAIAAQAGSATVAVGSYDTITLALCAEGKSGGTPAPGYVNAMFEIASEAKSFATDPDTTNPNGVKEVQPGDSGGFTPIGNWGCSTKIVFLREPLQVAAGAEMPLTVVFDPTYIASSTPNVSPGMGGCRGSSDGHSRGICVSYPSIVPYVGDGAPMIERFLVAHHRTDPTWVDDAKANGYVAVVRRPDGLPLTAFVRPFFSETSAQPTPSTVVDPVYGGPGYFGETAFSSFAVAADGSIAFVTGGDRDTNAAVFTQFALGTHTGIVGTHDGGTWHYHAKVLAPAP